jgi:hypothetical protein
LRATFLGAKHTMQQLTGVGMPHIHFSNKDSFGFNRPSGTGIAGFAFPGLLSFGPPGRKEKICCYHRYLDLVWFPSSAWEPLAAKLRFASCHLSHTAPRSRASHAGVSSGAELGNAAKAFHTAAQPLTFLPPPTILAVTALVVQACYSDASQLAGWQAFRSMVTGV